MSADLLDRLDAVHGALGGVLLAAQHGPGGPRSVEGVAAYYDRPTTVSSPASWLDRRSMRWAGPLALAARGRTAPLVLGHDVARRVGEVIAWADTPACRTVRAVFDATPAGDEAMVWAAEAGFSVGVVPSESQRSEAGVLVSAGWWQELTLTKTPASPACRVTAVGGRPVRWWA